MSKLVTLILKEPIDLHIGLEIERNRGYCMKPPKNFQDGSYSIDAIFMHVRNANHNVHSYGNGNEKSQLKKKKMSQLG
jgi:DNA-directed RNA polymerase subunit alpha